MELAANGRSLSGNRAEIFADAVELMRNTVVGDRNGVPVTALHSLPASAYRQAIHVLMQVEYDEFAKGKVRLDQLKNYDWFRNPDYPQVAGSTPRLLQKDFCSRNYAGVGKAVMDLDTHHVVERYIQKLLGIVPPTDSVPGFPMPRLHVLDPNGHPIAGTHDRLSELLKAAIPPPPQTNTMSGIQIVQALKRVYTQNDVDYQRLWPVAKAWIAEIRAQYPNSNLGLIPQSIWNGL